MQSGALVFFIFVVLFLVLLFIGWPIGFSIAASTIISYIFVFGGTVLGNFAVLTFNAMFNYNLLALPVFILMGQMIIYGGVSEDLFEALTPLMSRFRGGLIQVTIFANLILGACCGSTVAATTAMSTFAVPELAKRGYKKSIIYGSLASAGNLSALIPPSVTMIVYCAITSVSVGQLFIAGIIPGIILAILFAVVSYIWMKRDPAIVPKTTNTDLGVFTALLYSIKRLYPVLLLITLVLGVIYLGIGTPTEAGIYGVVGASIIAIAKNKLTLKKFQTILLDTVRISGTLFFIITMSSVYSFALNALGLKNFIINMLGQISVTPISKIIIIWIVLLVMGMFIDSSGVTMIATPIFLPVIIDLGFDAVWFGVFMVLAITIGNITPPIGVTLFAVQSVTGDKLEVISRGCLPYWVSFFVATLLITIFPSLTSWLVHI